MFGLGWYTMHLARRSAGYSFLCPASCVYPSGNSFNNIFHHFFVRKKSQLHGAIIRGEAIDFLATTGNKKPFPRLCGSRRRLRVEMRQKGWLSGNCGSRRVAYIVWKKASRPLIKPHYRYTITMIGCMDIPLS